jgi:hypothetical protein
MDEWVVMRQDGDGDRYFLTEGGYISPDFFRAARFTQLSQARREAIGGYIVIPAREAYQLTVVFDQRQDSAAPGH